MDKLGIRLRLSRSNDLREMQEMFMDTVLTVCKDDYSTEQIEAWTSTIENTQQWLGRIDSQYFLVAELDHKIVGYASLRDNNYLDLLYVHKDYQRRGIAAVLYAEMEGEAFKKGAKELQADVSKTAKPFFEHMGFSVLAEQRKTIKGVEITNYRMAKQLPMY